MLRNPEPPKREYRQDIDDVPEGVDPDIYFCFAQDATRYDMQPDLRRSKHSLMLAWNPWGLSL